MCHTPRSLFYSNITTALPVLTLLFVCACNPSSETGAWLPETGAFTQIDSMLTEHCEAEEIPGMAVGVVFADTLAWAKGYGVLSLDDPQPVTPTTLFRIASVTKVFTATAIVKLEASGALSLDDPVHEHLSWFEVSRPPATGRAPITIRHLLTHTAGMPRDSRLTDFSRLYQPSREDAIAALPDQRLQTPPGETYAYSNLGYGILGEIIATLSKMSYTAYLEHEIFNPLGMNNTLVHPTPDDHTAWGHGPRRLGGSRSKAGFWELRFATPAGGMASSVKDLSKFVILQLAPYAGTAPALLSSNTIRNMHRVHHMTDSTRGGSGLAWGVEISNGQHLVYHGGELPEQTAFVLIDLQAQIGIILVTNAQDVDANGLAHRVLRVARSAVADL